MTRKKAKYIILFLLLCICTVLYLFITPWPGISFTDTKDTPEEAAAGYIASITRGSGATYYETLQAAVNDAEAGETITLLNDTSENIVSQNSSYTLDMKEHIIDGSSSGRVYYISGGTVTLKNGTLTNGNAGDNGGGLYIENADVTLEKMTVKGNRASNDGGGVYSESGTIKIENSNISDNSASYQGGGVYSADITLTNVTFEQNTSKSGGAALYISRALEAALTGCTFRDNRGTDPNIVNSTVITAEDDTGYFGGTAVFNRCNIINNDNIQHTILLENAWWLDDKPINVTFNDCVISDNTAFYTGAVRMADYSIVTLNNTVVKNNTAFGTAIGATRPVAGGISVHNSVDNSLTVSGGAVYNNTADNGDANDLFIGTYAKADIIAACDMADGDTGSDFSNYVWRLPDSSFIDKDKKITGRFALDNYNTDLLLTAYNAITPPTVLYGGTEYTSLRDAIDAAKAAGDAPALLELLPGKNKDGERVPSINSFYTDSVTVDHPIILDTGDCSLNTKDDALFTVSDGGSLTLRGKGTLSGLIDVENDSTLIFATETKSDLNVRLGNENASVALDDSFVNGGKLNIEIDKERVNALTTPNRSSADISYVIVSNARDKLLLSDVELTYKGKQLINIYTLMRVVFAGSDIAAVNPTVQNDLYVSINNGDNNHDGSSETDALRTIEAAIAKLKAQGDGGTIYLLDTAVIKGDTVWEGSRNAKIVIQRYSSTEDVDDPNMIQVDSGSLTLANITIDGGSESDYINCGSMIKVSQNAELILDNGAVLQNNDLVFNKIGNGNYLPGQNNDYLKYSGGAVFTKGGKVTIDGGSITGCRALLGGGIYCEGGTVVMKDGTIEGNTAAGKLKVTTTDPQSHYKACGGGITVTGANGHIIMSGGTFIGNNATVGGGLSIGTADFTMTKKDRLPSNYSARTYSGTDDWAFIMTGGTFTENTTDAEGGALYVQSTYEAQITGGKFFENTCKGGNFGGGAIYVNGGKDDFPDGELWLQNVLIHNNDAQLYGGGIAGCNTSGTVINAKDGSVIYGNTALCDTGTPIPCDISSATSSTEVGKFTSGNKEPQTVDYFTQYMLDGTPYHWQFAIDSIPFSRDDYAPEDYLDSNRGKIVYTASEPKPGTVPNDIAVEITDNHSLTCGGGIGSNGSIFIGDPFVSNSSFIAPDTFDVTKKWEDEDHKIISIPDDIEQLNIWLLTVSRGSLNNKIYRQMKPWYNYGEWIGTVSFTELDDGEIPILLEQVIYKDGRHVWSVSEKDKAAYGGIIGSAVDDAMEKNYSGAAYTWSDSASSPYTSKFDGNAEQGFTITNYTRSTGQVQPPKPSQSQEPDPEPSQSQEPNSKPSQSQEPNSKPSQSQKPNSEPSQSQEPNSEPSQSQEPDREQSQSQGTDQSREEQENGTLIDNGQTNDTYEVDENLGQGHGSSPNTGIELVDLGVIALFMALTAVLAFKVFSTKRN